MITAIVPAAGASTRMGRPKALLPWGETTVLGQVIANLWAGGADEVLVVTTEQTGYILNVDDPARTVRHVRVPGGTMTQSLQSGILRLEPATSALLVLLADQPMIGPEIIRLVVDAHGQDGHNLVAAAHRGRRGHPVLFGRRYFADLLGLAPDEPPRAIIERHRHSLHLVDAPTDAVLADLDTPEAYEAWRRRFRLL